MPLQLLQSLFEPFLKSVGIPFPTEMCLPGSREAISSKTRYFQCQTADPLMTIDRQVESLGTSVKMAERSIIHVILLPRHRIKSLVIAFSFRVQHLANVQRPSSFVATLNWKSNYANSIDAGNCMKSFWNSRQRIAQPG